MLSERRSNSLTVNGGILDLNGISTTVGTFGGTGGTIETSGSASSATLEIDGSGTFSGNLGAATTGTLAYTIGNSSITNTNIVIFTGSNNNASGLVTINTGATLQLGNGGTFASSGTTIGSGANVTDNGTLAIDTTIAAVGVSKKIVGTGALTLMAGNTSTVNISGGNGQSTYSGATTINGGTLKAGSANATSISSAFVLGTATSATFDVNGYSETIGSLAGGSSTGGTVTLEAGAGGSSALTTGHDNTSTTYSGSISGAGTITKVGTGTWTVNGSNNTYSGLTTISAGSYLANNSGGSATGSGSVSVGSSGTLGGSGTIAPTGAATVSLGGKVQAGLGAADTSALTFNISGSTATSGAVISGAGSFNFNLTNSGASNVANTVNTVTSGGVFTPYAGAFTFSNNVLNLSNVSSGALSLGEYTLFAADTTTSNFFGGLTLSGTSDANGGYAITSGLQFTGLGSGYTAQLEENTLGTATDIQLDITAAPEPSTWAMLAGGLAFLVIRLRRRNGVSL